MNNINDFFKNNITNIKIYKEYNNYLLLSCVYNNNNILIKLFYNPQDNPELLNEQNIYKNINDNMISSLIYKLGYIDFDIFFNKDIINEFINYMNTIYDEKIINNNTKEIFKSSFKNLINQIDKLDIEFINYYKHSLSNDNKYICKLLLYFINNIDKKIYITILDNYIDIENSYSFLDYYNNNIIIHDDNNIDFNNELLLILYIILNNIELLYNKYQIIHNNINLENIYIIPDNNFYKCIFINFDMSIYKANNNNMIDYYIFLSNFINYTKKKYLSTYNNYFYYNNYNYKILNKLLFKSNNRLKNLIYKNHILYINNIKSFFCDNIITNNNNNNNNKFYVYPLEFNNNCIIPNIKKFKNKHLIKYLKKINYI
jgi:hypothetical protein